MIRTESGSNVQPRGSTGSADGHYTVRRGDTLSQIAARHGVSLAALERANPEIARHRFIFPGDVLVLPGARVTSVVVRPGDSLSQIAARTGTTWQALQAANRLTDPNLIFPGQRLVVPTGDAASAPRTATPPARPTPATPAATAQTGAGTSGDIGARILATAEQYRGRWSVNLRGDRGDNLPMRGDVSPTVCCANFVSAVLIEAGALPASRHQVSVTGLASTLRSQGWTVVPRGQAPQPGDVAIIRGNGVSHTEIVATGGRMIGSNGTDARGQRIGYDYVSYATQNAGYFLRPPAAAATGGTEAAPTGGAAAATGASGVRGGTLHLSAQDVIDLKKTLQTEWVQSAGDDQARGIIDTILNRQASGHWGTTIADVVNARAQFSDINGRPAHNDGRNSVDDLPNSIISRRVDRMVDTYLAERAGGRPSSVGSNLNYANPYYSDAVNLRWIMALDGPVFGSGRAIHRHGTTPDLERFRPAAFAVSLN